MKSKIRNQQLQPRFFICIAAIPLIFGSGIAKAEPIDLSSFIANRSFEEFATPELEEAANNAPFDLTDPIFWDPYFEEGSSIYHRIGTLRADAPGTNWFSQPIPDGSNRVLLLFKDSPVQPGTGAYGVEQTLDVFFEQNRIYSVRVDVGNPNSDQGYELEGIPNYRVELYAGNTLIAENAEQLDIPDGEYRTVTISTGLISNPALVDEPLRIRLVNENNIDPAFPDNSIEVDFDNVRLEALPIEAGPSEIRSLTAGKNGFIEIRFEIEGKGSKQLLLLGMGESLDFDEAVCADDPFLSAGGPINKNGISKIGHSDDWIYEAQVGEIGSIIDATGLETALTDSGIIFDLGSGSYHARVATKGQYETEKGQPGIYAGFKIFDLNPDSNTSVTYNVTPPSKEAKGSYYFQKKK